LRRPLRKLTLSVPQRSNLATGEAAVARGLAIASGVKLAKDLGNLPGNICTPTYLGDQALQLAKDFAVKVTVLDRPEIEKLGMGTFLSVTNGSAQPPRFIVLEYSGATRKQKPLVLVGKGITFDTGGISLKPGEAMDEMKFDMCGRRERPRRLSQPRRVEAGGQRRRSDRGMRKHAGSRATKPGDVVKSMSGRQSRYSTPMPKAG
jgi:leucyl aminopeptidase